MARQPECDTGELRLGIGGGGHEEHTTLGARPDAAIGRTGERVHTIGRRVGGDGEGLEARRGTGEREMDHAAAVGGNPEIARGSLQHVVDRGVRQTDRKSTRLNSSHGYTSYAVFCLKKKKD